MITNYTDCNYVYETCTTINMFCTGYAYLATYTCRVMYVNAQIQLQECCLPLTCVHSACSLRVGIKRGIHVSKGTAV